MKSSRFYPFAFVAVMLALLQMLNSFGFAEYSILRTVVAAVCTVVLLEWLGPKLIALNHRRSSDRE
ncbi:MAG: hypothetical protein B7Y98_08015 [Sphingomonas sp. 32-62-10]|nr:MAG: hypothetical protein B7Y98_08015 [Sphingomonas sp. 32-62-10]